jgi:hypothetical protein
MLGVWGKGQFHQPYLIEPNIIKKSPWFLAVIYFNELTCEMN